MPPREIIIDTDPGVDDILALLLALSASPDELKVLLISLTFGNIDISNVLRNTVSMFHVLELEKQWKVENNLPNRFEMLERFKPLVAVGADKPLQERILGADYFHGIDGLGGVHTTAPHFTPTETWAHIFNSTSTTPHPPNFTPTPMPSHLAILSLLASHPPDTITLVAIGPLTNFSLAASTDLSTFLHAKEVILMGGVIDLEGNVTPVAEFNHYACSFSAAHIYALTSPRPSSTLPVPFTIPENLERRLKLTIFPLDITTWHELEEETWKEATGELVVRGSPLAAWADVFMTATFKKMRDIYYKNTPAAEAKLPYSNISLHDPLCIWYLITSISGVGQWSTIEDRDIRIETTGQWTRGMCVVDRRNKYVEENLLEAVKSGDTDVWLHRGYGNKVRQVVESPEGHCEKFGGWMLERIFGVDVS